MYFDKFNLRIVNISKQIGIRLNFTKFEWCKNKLLITSSELKLVLILLQKKIKNFIGL